MMFHKKINIYWNIMHNFYTNIVLTERFELSTFPIPRGCTTTVLYQHGPHYGDLLYLYQTTPA